MIILGLDPGSTRIGYGLIKENKKNLQLIKSGILQITSKNKNQRFLELERAFSNLLKEKKPDVAAIEKLYFVKNLKTASDVMESRGILTLLITKNKIPILEYSPSEIKSCLTGYGLADKKTVYKTVAQILKIEKIEGGDDAADALAVAIITTYRKPLLDLINKNLNK
jgi:crossover junction endodeoxyribonuclease RuvC